MGALILIKRFGFTNLKGLKEAEIDLRPMTVLIGPNGSGKSTVTQALLLLRQSTGGNKLVPSGASINLGDLNDLFHNRNTSGTIDFVLLGSRDDTEYRMDIRFGKEGIRYLDTDFRTKHGVVAVRSDQNEGTFKIQPKELAIGYFKINIEGELQFPSPLRTAGGIGYTQQNESDFKKIINQLDESFHIIENELDHIWYIPSIRGTARAFHNLEAKPAENIDLRLDTVLEERNAALLSTLAYEPEILDQVSEWCKEILDIDIRERLVSGRKITIESMHKDSHFNIANEGFGLNQLVFLLTQFALAPRRRGIVAIEEPEIHLHHQAQTKLIRVLIKEALFGVKKVILSTHSEHIIFQLLTMVADGELKPEHLALYNFIETKEGFQAEELTFDEQGRLKKGLPDFFKGNLEAYRRYIEILTSSQDG